MKCPKMNDTKGWIKYYRYQWKKELNDPNSPQWVKDLAKYEITKK